MSPSEAGRPLGLFGGTFDPPHNAHVALASLALAELALDELRWIPTGQPWQKRQQGRDITPATQRAAMVALAIEGEPRFTLSRIEVDRQGPSFTLDTVAPAITLTSLAEGATLAEIGPVRAKPLPRRGQHRLTGQEG